MPICKPRNLKLAWSVVRESAGGAPSVSSSAVWELKGRDGQTDRLLVFSTLLQMFSLSFRVFSSGTALQFMSDDSLFLSSANRLLIQTSPPPLNPPTRAHAFQSHRWDRPKIELAAQPGEIGCQSSRLSYYPLSPAAREGATPVSMWSWSIHNHFPVTAVALSGDSPAPQTSHVRGERKNLKESLEFGMPSFWPRKAEERLRVGRV